MTQEREEEPHTGSETDPDDEDNWPLFVSPPFAIPKKRWNDYINSLQEGSSEGI